jgi:hypothetical protein
MIASRSSHSGGSDARTGRGKGIASALSLRAIIEAARLGFDRLYLFTPNNETLYARMDWKTFERIDHNGLSLTLMERRTMLVENASLHSVGSPKGRS